MIPAKAARSLAGFLEWSESDDFPEEGRICYLAGELYIDMGHERIDTHVALKTALAEVLSALARELDTGRFLTDGFRLVDRGADLVAEPDGCFVSRASVTEGRVLVRPSNDGTGVADLSGAVDMVLEVVSSSSVHKDTVMLPELYWRAGIAEYWLIDARKKKMSFTLYRHTPEGYVETRAAGGWFPSQVFGRKFRLERSEDSIGFWQYTLHVRPLS